MKIYIARELCEHLGINVSGSSRTLKRISKKYGISGVRKILEINGSKRVYRCYTEEEFNTIIKNEKSRKKITEIEFYRGESRNIRSAISVTQNENRKKGLYHRLTF